MAYNPNQRRGLYRKPKPRTRLAPGQQAQPDPVAHNGQKPYLDAFIEWSRSVKQLNETTCRNRWNDLKRFLQWCDERGLDEPSVITKPILERYQQHLFYYRKKDGEPLSHAMQSRLVLSVKSYFQWLTRENHLLYNPASELELPKRPPRLPRGLLSEAEVARVLALPDTASPYGLRDRALLETLYSTGIRRMELINLKVHDLDLSGGALRVNQGKGGKDRILPLGENLRYWLKRYLNETRPQLVYGSDNKHLFLTDYGEPWARNRLNDAVKKYLYHARIDKPGACHLFRHAMATHMLNHGADIRFIQAMLGHAELSTTQIYTRVSIEKLREIHAATHPGEAEDRASGGRSEVVGQEAASDNQDRG